MFLLVFVNRCAYLALLQNLGCGSAGAVLMWGAIPWNYVVFIWNYSCFQSVELIANFEGGGRNESLLILFGIVKNVFSVLRIIEHKRAVNLEFIIILFEIVAGFGCCF
jgi:hypothetical protein